MRILPMGSCIIILRQESSKEPDGFGMFLAESVLSAPHMSQLLLPKPKIG
jgi:hypothetical protein